MELSAIILAAGKGTRMNSDILKVAHEVAGKPIVSYVVDTVTALDLTKLYLVIGHQSELIKQIIPSNSNKIEYVLQKEQLGTGHAVIQVESVFSTDKEQDIIVLAGDCPLIKEETIKNLLNIHQSTNAATTILTTKLDIPGTYGRMLRNAAGDVTGIREAKDCSPEELNIKEINTGIYCFKSRALFKALKEVKTNNKQKEYYLTDVIQILKDQAHTVSAHCTPHSEEVLGVNTRMDLAEINKVIYQKNNHHFMTAGVTIIDPNSTFIDSTVEIGRDSIIYPFTIIQGKSKIGTNCKIGPNSFISNGNISNSTQVPPFSHIS